MKKAVLISLGALLLIGLFILAYKLTAPPSSLKTQTSNTPIEQKPMLPSGGSVSITTGASSSSSPETSVEAMSILGVGGQPISTINFIIDPATTEDSINSGYYYLGYHTLEGSSDNPITENPPYIITYISSTHYFNIELLEEPIGPMRVEAERYLMGRLGISESQLCQLNYTLSVPNSVNSQFASRNLGFSFCPGAVVLPK